MSDRPVLKRKSARGRKPGSKNRPKDHRAAQPVAPEVSAAVPIVTERQSDEPVGSRKVATGRRHSASETKAQQIALQRERVQVLLAGGMKVSAIARVLGISEPTCRKRFAGEIQTGVERKQAEVIEALFRSATSGAGNVSAIRTFLEISTRVLAARDVEQRVDEAEMPASTQPATAPAKLGKKEEAKLRAQTAGVGSPWGDLLLPPGARAN